MCAACVVAGWFSVAAAHGQTPGTGNPPATKPPEPGERLTQIDTDVTALRKQLDDLKKRADENQDLMRRLSRQLDSLDKLVVQVQQTTGDVNALRDRVERLEQDFRRAQADVRRQFYQPPGGTLGTPPGSVAPGLANVGTIRLMNTYLLPMTVNLNGMLYLLQPGETRLLTLPAGSFTYEVLGVQPNLVRILTPNDTYTIHIGVRP
jgi:hypothetical protein